MRQPARQSRRRIARRKPGQGRAKTKAKSRPDQCLETTGPHWAGLVRTRLRADQAFATAFTLADRRLLWRAALLRWTRPLLTIESMTGWASLKALRRVVLVAGGDGVGDLADGACACANAAPRCWARCLTACRAAFSADLVFATLEISAELAGLRPRSVGRGRPEVNRNRRSGIGIAGRDSARLPRR